MIDLISAGRMIEAWAVVPGGRVFLFRGCDTAFAVQQAFVRDGKVRLDGVELDRPRKQRREKWVRLSSGRYVRKGER